MDIVIVGAGIAGLTLASLLAEKGFKPLVVEKQPNIGGLAMSYHYDNWSIDIGPHRFHTDDEKVAALIKETMQDQLINIIRDSKVYFQDRHLNWPLSFSTLFKLPPKLFYKSFWDLFFRPKINDDTFESYVISRYGRTLTEYFFREYTEKFLKIGLDKCHRDWAETGINRATIDKDVRTASIIDLVIGVLFPKKGTTEFWYPSNGSIDEFPRMLAKRIENAGGKILTGVDLKKSIIENDTIKAIIDNDGNEYSTDFLFWSGTTYGLEELLNVESSGLNYISTVLCNMLVDGEPAYPAQWEYFSSRETIFSRISTNTSFNPELAPDGYFGICIEIVNWYGSFLWKNAENLLGNIAQDLIKARVLYNYNSIAEVHFERVRNTYPLYSINYLNKLKGYTERLARYKNLLAFGRSGGFWYNNMDHSIRASIDIANMIEPDEFDNNRELPIKGVHRGDF